MKFYRTKALRKILLPLLKRFNPGDITIRHHYTKNSILLHSFRHKGYWYHGRSREKETMASFKRLIRPGDTVIEVGGHIGYITQYFSLLAGPTGKVVVFEPGDNNLKYIEKNTSNLENVELIKKAVSDQNGTVSFFKDDLTGQNNSIIKDYSLLSGNLKNSYVKSNVEECKVESTTLDHFIQETNQEPDFVKIDIEGAELLALKGMTDCLKQKRPILMIEITDNADAVTSRISEYGYGMYSPSLKHLTVNQVRGNTFCLHLESHKELITALATA